MDIVDIYRVAIMDWQAQFYMWLRDTNNTERSEYVQYLHNAMRDIEAILKDRLCEGE